MGPLHGLTILEFAGIGPAPFCGMLFSDMGAEVIRIDRPPQPDTPKDELERRALLSRGRKSIVVDMKMPSGLAVVQRLIATADALYEGFRPGVMERLGLGPDACRALSPKLVYGRVTGWGQEGPLAAAAGHDINYIALTGALAAIGGHDRRPVPPLNLVGDYGGGALYLAFGMVCALLEARHSGQGQVVDAAIIDGTACLMSAFYELHAQQQWTDRRADNLIDSGAPWYNTYETADGKYISIGAIEPHFYALLLEKLDLSVNDLPQQNDRAGWPVLREVFNAKFKERSRDAWCDALEGTDACFAPVLSMAEAPAHLQLQARSTFVEHDGFTQPAPAPRFSRSQTGILRPSPGLGEHTVPILQAAGLSTAEIDALLAAGVVQAGGARAASTSLFD